jgi:hypothetical protein
LRPEGYKTAVSDYSNSLRKAEKASSNKFSSEVDGIKPPARPQKIISKNNSHHIGNLRLPSRDFTKPYQEVADHLLEIHFLSGSIMKDRRGCIQGEILSPLLWNMVIDSHW